MAGAADRVEARARPPPCRLGMTKGGGGCGVYCGGVELADAWRTKVREAAGTDPLRAMAPVRGGMAGGGPVRSLGGGELMEARLSVEGWEGTRGGSWGSFPGGGAAAATGGGGGVTVCRGILA